MKKLLVAAIAAASFGLVAHAENETTLYGSIAYDAAVVKKNDLSGGFTTNFPTSKTGTVKRNRESADFDTNVVKWGIKGKEEISSDLTALYQLEFNGKTGKGRYAWVALSGASWGTLKIGRQDSLYYLLTNYNDIFQNTFWGSNVYYDEGLRRPDKAIAYVSPNFNGFNFAIVGILNGTKGDISDNYYGLDGAQNVTDSRAFGAGQVGAWYAQNGFFASLVYEYIKSDLHLVADAGDISLLGLDSTYKGTELIAGTVGYSNDTFKVGLNAQHKASDGNKGSLVGEYYFGPNTIRAGFGYASSNDLRAAKSIGMNYNWQQIGGTGTANDPYVYGDVASSTNKKKVYTYALGYQYNFSKRTYTYVEADFIDWNVGDIHRHSGDSSKAVPTSTTTTKGLDDGYSVRVGLRHNF
ncbi:MAG: porin [Cardiobacteriaceae bacterium]|nr:porin [Cardiobacteriaceae bacterium]